MLGRLRVRLFVLLAVLTVTGGFAGCGGGGDNDEGGPPCTYENGRTYIQQVNFCNLMRDQGVPCQVPPPPSC